MSSYIMDTEEEFVGMVSDRIGGCETLDELMWKLVEDKCFLNIMYLSGPEQDEWVTELWNEYWSNYV